MIDSENSYAVWRNVTKVVRLILTILVFAVVHSCAIGSGFSVSKSELQSFDKHFSGSYYNASKEGLLYGEVYLTQLLDIDEDGRDIDIVHLSMVDSTHLHIVAFDNIDTAIDRSWRTDVLDRNQWMIKGKIYRNQYFTTSRSKMHHWIPFISSRRDHATIRIGFMKDGRLIVSYTFKEVNTWRGESTETESNHTYYFNPIELDPQRVVAED